MTCRSRRRTIEIPIPRPFHFRLMIMSHGWIDLEPFSWDADSQTLGAVLKTGPQRAFAVRISSLSKEGPGKSVCQILRLEKSAGSRLTGADIESLERTVRWMFRLDDDFSPFQKICGRTKGLTWVKRHGLGPFLRNGDLFEEFVKMLLTTNVNWAGTKLMNRNLIGLLGQPVTGRTKGRPVPRAFPDPEAIAACSEKTLRREVRLGYRAPYLIEFAKRVASGKIMLERFLDANMATIDLAREISQLKGFGPYAVSALLLSLGRYDRLILDSWTRKTAARRHFKSGKATDNSLRRVYAPWGPWKALAIWFECAYDTWFKNDLLERKEGTRKQP